MSIQESHSIVRRLAVTAAVSVVLAPGVMAPVTQAADSVAQPTTQAPLLLAGTVGMERRQDNREDRRDDRDDRQDNRQDCRGEGDLAGKDKRDCKQEGRQENRDEAKGE